MSVLWISALLHLLVAVTPRPFVPTHNAVPASRSYADSSRGGAAGGVQPEESAYDRADGTMERRRNDMDPK
ncbi:unnamed protein product [Boreogadus saida]